MKIALALFLLAGAAQAEEVVIKLGTAAPEDTPWHKQLLRLKGRFEKESAGKVKLKLFMGSVKGGEDAMARQVAQGALQAAGLSTGALAILVPELDVFELPYRFSSSEEADKILDDPEVWNKVVELFRKKGLEPYIWSENGWRNFATKSKAIKTPADLKGLKMRSQENKVHIEMYKALGSSPVPISVPEVLSALQTGVVDGFDNTPLFAFATSWYQGAKSWTVSDHIYQPAIVVYNKQWFDSQPEDLKKLLVSNRSEETSYGRNLIRKLTEPLLKNLAESGLTITRLSAAEKDAFAKATKPIYAKVRGGLSAEGKALYDLVEKKLGKK
jgi:tripartite ATP-independent transporter DctP family solute receptor